MQRKESDERTNLSEIVQFQIAGSSVAVQGDPLRVGLGHGESSRVEPESFKVASFPVHLVGPLDLVQWRRHHVNHNHTHEKKLRPLRD